MGFIETLLKCYSLRPSDLHVCWIRYWGRGSTWRCETMTTGLQERFRRKRPSLKDTIRSGLLLCLRPMRTGQLSTRTCETLKRFRGRRLFTHSEHHLCPLYFIFCLCDGLKKFKYHFHTKNIWVFPLYVTLPVPYLPQSALLFLLLLQTWLYATHMQITDIVIRHTKTHEGCAISLMPPPPPPPPHN